MFSRQPGKFAKNKAKKPRDSDVKGALPLFGDNNLDVPAVQCWQSKVIAADAAPQTEAMSVDAGGRKRSQENQGSAAHKRIQSILNCQNARKSSPFACHMQIAKVARFARSVQL